MSKVILIFPIFAPKDYGNTDSLMSCLNIKFCLLKIEYN